MTILALITLASVLAAVAAVTVAWQTLQTERRRSEARMAALMASLAAERVPTGAEEPDAFRAADPDTLVLPAPEPVATSGALFGSAASPADPRTSGLPRFAVLAIGACLMVGAVSAVSLAVRGTPPAAAAQAPASLELVSLAHTRQGERLTISGLVRNPREAPAVDTVNAVVFFFDRTGGFLTSARAPIDFPRLGPGDESPFTISVAAPAGLGRYRVSFRRDEGGIVPHVDRRAGRATL